MFDIAWTQIFLILVVALILIGPKELALVMRTFGRWIGGVRHLSQEFYRQLETLDEDLPNRDG